MARFRKWIECNGWWNGQAESELRSTIRQQVKLFRNFCLLADTLLYYWLNAMVAIPALSGGFPSF